METGPWLKVSSDRQVEPGIKPATPGLQGKWLTHYTTPAPNGGIADMTPMVILISMVTTIDVTNDGDVWWRQR